MGFCVFTEACFLIELSFAKSYPSDSGYMISSDPLTTFNKVVSAEE